MVWEVRSVGGAQQQKKRCWQVEEVVKILHGVASIVGFQHGSLTTVGSGLKASRRKEVKRSGRRDSSETQFNGEREESYCSSHCYLCKSVGGEDEEEEAGI